MEASFFMSYEDYKVLQELRLRLPPVFSIGEIASFFPGKDAPKKFCERLVARGLLVRLKKGSYAFKEELDDLVIANYLVTCSYVSFETALSFYGMIPEFVPLVMSVSSSSKHKIFSTPVGSYEYFNQKTELFAAGMDRNVTSGGRALLIASREKALSDTLARRSEDYHNKDTGFMEALLSGLRIEARVLMEDFDLLHLEEIASLHWSRAPTLLLRYLKEKKS
jgi:hypothetical protein